MHTIAVINQKGGVGKTTTVANLAAALAERGCPTCIVDLDPQAHLTLHFGAEPGDGQPSVYDVLTGDAALADTLIPVAENLAVVPAVTDLAGAEVELAGTVGREQILLDAIEARPLDYRLALIDCPPSLNLLTLNALAAASEVVIPLQPHFLALQGLGKLLETVSLVQRRINPRLTVRGVVLCMYESATRLAAEVVDDLAGFFAASRDTDCPWAKAHIFENVIRRNVKLAECPSHGMTIFQYDASSNGAADYRALADEFVELYPKLFPNEPDEAAPPSPALPPPGYNPASPQRVVAPPARKPSLPSAAMAPAIVPPQAAPALP